MVLPCPGGSGSLKCVTEWQEVTVWELGLLDGGAEARLVLGLSRLSSN